jgi:hypothetical protein
VRERIDLRDAVQRIVLVDLDARARDVLLAPQPGHPGTGAGQCARERGGLADAAALDAKLLAVVERIRTVLAHERLDVGRVRHDDLDRDA